MLRPLGIKNKSKRKEVDYVRLLNKRDMEKYEIINKYFSSILNDSYKLVYPCFCYKGKINKCYPSDYSSVDVYIEIEINEK